MSKFWTNLITGADNQTIAIGRVLGLIVFVVFLVGVPITAMLTLARHLVTSDDWAKILSSLQTYVPGVIVSIGMLIGITAFSEPKPGDGK